MLKHYVPGLNVMVYGDGAFEELDLDAMIRVEAIIVELVPL